MLIELKKADLGVVSHPTTPAGFKNPQLPVELYGNFDATFFDMIKLAVSKKFPNGFFKCFKIATTEKESMMLYKITKTRDTAAIFQTFTNLGVALSELNIGFAQTSVTEYSLLLPFKVSGLLSKLGEPMNTQLCAYLIDLCKMLTALTMLNKNEADYTTESEVYFSDEGLAKLGTMLPEINESLTVNINTIKAGSQYAAVMYMNCEYTKHTVSPYKAPTSCRYVYNKLTTAGGDLLVITNTTYKEHKHYLVSKGNKTVYTDDELMDTNVFDAAEWLPNLINTLVSQTEHSWELKYFKTEYILHSKHKDIIISEDASGYMDLLEELSTVVENTDIHIYDGYFTGSVLHNKTAPCDLSAQYVSDAYAQQLYKNVLPHYATFDLKERSSYVKPFAKGDIYSMLFTGKSGTGKSTVGNVIAARCGLPFAIVNCSNNIEESDLIGTMIPNVMKKDVTDPEFVWQDGVLTKCVRNGYCIKIEELGFARPGVLGKLNSLLDDARQIELPTGEIVKAHPNFRLIATTNIAYEGTNRLNKAFINRFDIVDDFQDLPKAEAMKIVMDRTGYKDTSKLAKLYNVYEAICRYADEQNIDAVVSIRQLIALCTIGKYYKTAAQAVMSLMVNQAFIQEPDHLKFFTDNTIKNLDLTFKI